MTDAKPHTTMKRLRAISEAQFVAAQRRSAAESALADREGGDADSGVDTYWIGWLDNVSREDFVAELDDLGDPAFVDSILAPAEDDRHTTWAAALLSQDERSVER